MLLGIILDMINPYLSKIMVDRIIKKNELNLLARVLISIGAITIGRAVFGYIKEYYFDVLSSKVAVDIKYDLFNHIQSLPFEYFDVMNTGELMSRIGSDVDNIWRTVSFGMRLFIENIIYFVIASSILFYINWKLALICIIPMPLIAYLAVKLETKVDKCYGKISDMAAEINTTAQENIAGVRLVKAFAREKHEILKFLKLNKDNYKLNMEQSKIIAKYFPDIEFLTNLCMILMICFGGIFVMKSSMTLGTLIQFSGYVMMLIWPMRMIGWLSNLLAKNSASAKKIFKILDLKPSIRDKESPIHVDSIKGHIQFKNVSFKYDDEYVLKDINLDIKEGSTVAIMGATGSGKSSFINLIGRYYDVSSGQILIDGHDIKDLCLKDLRRNMSVVFQDTFLFSDTIDHNIRYGNSSLKFRGDDDVPDIVKRACMDACAHEFITNLEDGYQTIIGERGIGLSGGQKQRLCIARALVKDAGILILDDATSALDMETEYQLLKNLYNKKKKSTTFIIAHRISAVKNADLILFFENGRIVESGNHYELLKKKGKYYEIYNEQFKDFNTLEGVI